tara:strand:+ start:126 stop:1055 length:930 start_codon:yes stop_codon:yes gene_type:complete
MSKFVNQLEKTLLDQGKSQSTIKTYMNRLRKLNNDKNPTSLKFLRDIDNVKKYFEDKKFTVASKKSFIGSIVTILKASSKKIDNVAVEKYKNFLSKDELDSISNDKKSQKQKDNWLSWDEVLEIKKKLKQKAVISSQEDQVNKNEYNLLLDNLVLSFYVNLAPRRSKDFAIMKIQQPNEKLNDTNNYLTLENHLVFNDYKTDKKYGKQEIDISKNEELMEDLNLYLMHRKEQENEFNLLLKFNGRRFNEINDITRILNNIFKKNVSVNMLRAIYITDKFAENKNQMEETASDMGHSVSVQQGIYNKKDN